MHAELVRASWRHVDIKIVNGERMHILQWRRNMLWDEVLLDGTRQSYSRGLWGREKVYGLVFGRQPDGTGGTQVMLMLDPAGGDYEKDGMSQRIRGVRLETSEGPLIAYGSLDPKTLEKPATFGDWMKKSMGMEWGEQNVNGPH